MHVHGNSLLNIGNPTLVEQEFTLNWTWFVRALYKRKVCLNLPIRIPTIFRQLLQRSRESIINTSAISSNLYQPVFKFHPINCSYCSNISINYNNFQNTYIFFATTFIIFGDRKILMSYTICIQIFKALYIPLKIWNKRRKYIIWTQEKKNILPRVRN